MSCLYTPPCLFTNSLSHTRTYVYIHTRRDRQQLEQLKLSVPDTDELVMADQQGRIGEGLVTNMWVVRAGTVLTAPCPSVLSGTVRSAVLTLCRKHGIPCQIAHPTVQSLGEWDEAFVTNAGKLVCPVRRVTVSHPCVRGSDSTTRVLSDNRPITSRLQELMRQAMLDETVLS